MMSKNKRCVLKFTVQTDDPPREWLFQIVAKGAITELDITPLGDVYKQTTVNVANLAEWTEHA